MAYATLITGRNQQNGPKLVISTNIVPSQDRRKGRPEDTGPPLECPFELSIVVARGSGFWLCTGTLVAFRLRGAPAKHLGKCRTVCLAFSLRLLGGGEQLRIVEHEVSCVSKRILFARHQLANAIGKVTQMFRRNGKQKVLFCVFHPTYSFCLSKLKVRVCQRFLLSLAGLLYGIVGRFSKKSSCFLPRARVCPLGELLPGIRLTSRIKSV